MATTATATAAKIHETESGSAFYTTPWTGIFIFSMQANGSLFWKCLRYMKGNRVVYPVGLSRMGSMGPLTFGSMEDALDAAERLQTFGGTACYQSYPLMDKDLSRLFKKHS